MNQKFIVLRAAAALAPPTPNDVAGYKKLLKKLRKDLARLSLLGRCPSIKGNDVQVLLEYIKRLEQENAGLIHENEELQKECLAEKSVRVYFNKYATIAEALASPFKDDH